MKRIVEVTFSVEVETDDAKFTDEFMAEFRESFFRFYDMDDHAGHIAQLAVREVAEFSPHLPQEFVEGYGPIGEMGITASVVSSTMEVVATLPSTKSVGGAA